MKVQNNAWIFQNSVATTGNGEILYPNYNDQITIFITGTSTSRTIHFEGTDNDGNFYAIPAVKLPGLTIASSTTGNNEVWVINTTPWVSIRCRISAIDGGTVKIIGKIVDSGINLINSAKVDVLTTPADATPGSTTPTKGLAIAGTDGTSARIVKTSNDGTVLTQVTGSTAIKGTVQNVTTAGTRVQLPDYACREVTIVSKRANTGYIYVGGSDVSSTVYGAELAAKDSITLAVNNTNLIYIDSSVSGEGISYVAI